MTTKKTTAKPTVTDVPVVPGETEPLLTDPITGISFVLTRDDTGTPTGIETVVSPD